MERIIIILFILCNSYLSAQKIPQFLTKIKFEDAIGNSKVIEVGYDLSIDPCLPNHPEFGEVLDLSPFDSVFDVRAANFWNFTGRGSCRFPSSDLLSKRIIGGGERIITHSIDSCIAASKLLFFIRAMHQPVTISWTAEDFTQINCLNKNWSFFTPDRSNEFFFNHEWVAGNPRYGCISKGSYTLQIGKHYRLDTERKYELYHEVEGIGMDTIFGVVLVHDHTFYYCDPLYNDTEDVSQLQFNLYPNPATDQLTIDIPSGSEIKYCSIVNLNGRLIMNLQTTDIKTIDIGTLPSGIYFLCIKTDTKKLSVKRFIKL